MFYIYTYGREKVVNIMMMMRRICVWTTAIAGALGALLFFVAVTFFVPRGKVESLFEKWRSKGRARARENCAKKRMEEVNIPKGRARKQASKMQLLALFSEEIS